MEGKLLVVGTIILSISVILLILFFLLKKQKKTNFSKTRESLEREKNLIGSTPVLLELSKLEPIIKNEKMEEKYQKWQEKFSIIKDEELPSIDDLLIELDDLIEQKDFDNCKKKIAKIE